MPIELSTAGIKIKYAVEATADTRPTTGYTALPGIKAIPDLNPEPASLDATDLDQEEWKVYIPGLKDIGGAIALMANNNDTFMTAWETMVSAYDGAAAADKGMWYEVYVPGLTKSFFFKAIPSDLGLSAIDVDAVLEIEAFLTPVTVHGWDTAST